PTHMCIISVLQLVPPSIAVIHTYDHEKAISKVTFCSATVTGSVMNLFTPYSITESACVSTGCGTAVHVSPLSVENFNPVPFGTTPPPPGTSTVVTVAAQIAFLYLS